MVIWALGMGMILLAGVLWLKQKFIFILGLVIVVVHNLLAPLSFGNSGFVSLLWYTLHQSGTVVLTDTFGIRVHYPILPMFGLICIGYGMGSLFTYEKKEERISIFKKLSGILLLLFVSLRLLNEYGDPGVWVHHEYFYRTVFSFLNVTKYPMSLDYILITFAGAFCFITYVEKHTHKLWDYLAVFGKVSMSFYLGHLFLIHGLAVLLVGVLHYDSIHTHMTLLEWKTLKENYGYSLVVVYIIWLSILGILYLLCKKHRTLKSKYPNSFLKFI